MNYLKQILLVIMSLITYPVFAVRLQPHIQSLPQPQSHYDFDIYVMNSNTMIQSSIAHLENITSPTFTDCGFYTDKDNNGYFEYYDEYKGDYNDAPNYKSMIAAGFTLDWIANEYYRFNVPKDKVYNILHLNAKQANTLIDNDLTLNCNTYPTFILKCLNSRLSDLE